MNPTCIILKDHYYHKAIAWNGRIICMRSSYYPCKRQAESFGYDIVPLNSRAGRTILDLVEGRIT